MGVGVQKSGTTWLSKQLKTANNYVPGLMKEYHIFDTLHLGGEHHENTTILKKLKNFSQDFDEKELHQRCQIVKSFYRNTQHYYDFFDELLEEEYSFTADITPLYAGFDLSPQNNTMTLMRFPIKWRQWRSQHEETLQRRANHQGNQAA